MVQTLTFADALEKKFRQTQSGLVHVLRKHDVAISRGRIAHFLCEQSLRYGQHTDCHVTFVETVHVAKLQGVLDSTLQLGNVR